jgi:alpha-L-glutamate ligase-like protein
MSTKPAHILGLNSRYQYTGLNPSSAKKYGFSKLRTKALLAEHNIPTAQIYHIFEHLDDIEHINWTLIPTPFVIKPASGSAGKGIILIKKKAANEPAWFSYDGEKLTAEDLNLHVNNILDGEFSTWGSHHKAIVEEKINSHPGIGKYSYRGTPDIRVIVFNSVPVMAMIRIPTKESEGKANLDKGAIGLGIDLATGITTHGIKGKGERITHFPNSKKKVNGIKIPYWNRVLELAVKAANIAGFVFMGADIFINVEKGPMIVELNGFPGLSIQLANRVGLKRRMDRVEGLDVRDPVHGVKIAQALFAESFADEIIAKEGLSIIPTDPKIIIYDEDNHEHLVSSLVNTSRFRSAISEQLAEEMGLIDLDDLLWQQESLEGKVPVVEATIRIKDRKIKTAVIVSKKLNRAKHKIELGKKDIEGFLVSTEGI